MLPRVRNARGFACVTGGTTSPASVRAERLKPGQVSSCRGRDCQGAQVDTASFLWQRQAGLGSHTGSASQVRMNRYSEQDCRTQRSEGNLWKLVVMSLFKGSLPWCFSLNVILMVHLKTPPWPNWHVWKGMLVGLHAPVPRCSECAGKTFTGQQRLLAAVSYKFTERVIQVTNTDLLRGETEQINR